MKFAKEFSSEMVPEWQQAYMNYDYLKSILNEIINFKNRDKIRHSVTTDIGDDIEEGKPQSPITVKTTARNGLKTTFLMTAEEGGEYEMVFFRRLDDEFNKVDKFYKEKVEEMMKEEVMLNRQIDALEEFRVRIENGERWLWEDRSVSPSEIAASIFVGAKSKKARVLAIGEGSSRRTLQSEEGENSIKEDENSIKEDKVISVTETIDKSTSSLSRTRIARAGTLEVLECVGINNRENLRKVESKLKYAFVEFYRKLCLLKSYSFLNELAFSKILKKYDKITSRDATKVYMNMVDNSYLGSSDEIMRLMEKLEATFIKHFSNGVRTKGMKILRPNAKRQRHRLTFSTGFMAGCVFCLIVVLATITVSRNILHKEGRIQYMNTMLPLYSLFGFIVLHMVMYAADIYFWGLYRVNYSFIFGFKQGTELGYRQVLFVSFSIGAFALLCVLANLDMEADPNTKNYQALTELLPLFLLIVMFVVLVMPFNIFYRSSRFFFLRTLFHCLTAPFYQVTLPDFILADQLCSQVQALRSLEFYICYYGNGDFKQRQNTCIDSNVFKAFLFIVAAFPFTSRLLQCLRRVFEEKNIEQAYNAFKYFLVVVAVCLGMAYEVDDNEYRKMIWRILGGIIAAIAVVFCTYWDFVYDWGLLNRTSKNRWLRDKLLVPYKEVYFIAMILNVILRFAWMQTVLDFNFDQLHTQTVVALVASLEIIRRGIWNFFRLENEHLNNVGKYRAFKTVPLPFN